MTETNTIIKVEKLTKSFKDNHVLTGVNFNVQSGKILALLGPNGAGKTTTVRILSTLLKSDGGTVTVNGHDINEEPEKVREVIGLTGQSASVDELLTGYENLVMMGRLYRLTKKSAVERANELLADFDLVKAKDRPVKTYSGGMRRRLDLAVSLIAAPPVIFLDEPTTGLDPRSRLAMWGIIEELKNSGTAILLTTQYLDEADQLADQIIVIDGGKVIAEGTAQQLKNKIGNDRLELSFKNSEVFEAAQKTLGKKIVDKNTQEYSVTTIVKNTNKDIRQALDALESAGIEIASLTVHKPTLDDVFLSLTGKQAKSKTKSTQGKKVGKK